MNTPYKMIIEALLFASDRPLTVREIHAVIPDMDRNDIMRALKELQGEYDAMKRSLALKEVAGGYQLRTKSEYSPYIQRMFKSSSNKLSQAALETLSIIAYKQPVLRQEIERLRGVDVGGIVRTLLEKKLVRIMGRKNLPGKPLIYGTTKRFLEVFDLNDIDALPKLKEIREFGVGEEKTEPVSEERIVEEPPDKRDATGEEKKEWDAKSPEN
ncbi:MAG: SMC-Scp complex subunit ScpB [Deltaproteobacteria bacterium]|nr:SMC-Scp complex subunit ScpB [Deltaproteobacteria bacterium]